LLPGHIRHALVADHQIKIVRIDRAGYRCSIRKLRHNERHHQSSIQPQTGLYLEDGLNRLGGNWKLYLKLLSNFVAEYGETPTLLLHELNADRREDAIARVHAIRGVAGNLGGK
jgi:hypothetical protein